LATLDIIIIAAFILLTLTIGMLFARVGGRSLEDYFVAGKSLPWWAIGMSSVATYSSAGTGAAFTMLVFNEGLVGNWWWWLPWVIWMPLVAIIWAKLWRRLGIMTAAEIITVRYSGRVSRYFRAGYAFFFAGLYATISLGYGTGWLLRTIGPVVDWTNLEIMLLGGGVVLIYTVVSGLYGVVYNDVLQFIIFIIANIIFIPLVINAVGGLEHVLATATEVRGPEFFKPLPPGGSITQLTVVALILQGLFFAQSPSGGEGHVAQRFLSAKNEFHAVVGQLLNAFLSLALRSLPFIFLGITAVGLFPKDFAEPGEIWAILVRDYAAPGILGLLIAAELSAYMSTVSTQMNWGSSYLVSDVYKSLINKDASNNHYVWVGRFLSAAVLVGGFFIAYFQVKGMMEWFLFINSVVIAFVLPLSWLRFFWWRLNIYGELTAIIGGIPLGYIIWFPLGFSQRPFWQGFFLLFFAGWFSIVFVTLMTKQEKMEVLKNFYNKCKPPGLWGPVTDAMRDEERAILRGETIHDIIDAILGIVLFGSMVTTINAFIARNSLLGIITLALLTISGFLLIRRLSRMKVFSSLGKNYKEPKEE